jgi:hypothetical protein
MSTVGSHVNCWGDVAVARQRFWLRLAGPEGDVGRECRILRPEGYDFYRASSPRSLGAPSPSKLRSPR